MLGAFKSPAADLSSANCFIAYVTFFVAGSSARVEQSGIPLVESNDDQVERGRTSDDRDDDHRPSVHWGGRGRSVDSTDDGQPKREPRETTGDANDPVPSTEECDWDAGRGSRDATGSANDWRSQRGVLNSDFSTPITHGFALCDLYALRQ